MDLSLSIVRTRIDAAAVKFFSITFQIDGVIYWVDHHSSRLFSNTVKVIHVSFDKTTSKDDTDTDGEVNFHAQKLRYSRSKCIDFDFATNIKSGQESFCGSFLYNYSDDEVYLDKKVAFPFRSRGILS